jgi:2-isopropylmalate synthase
MINDRVVIFDTTLRDGEQSPTGEVPDAKPVLSVDGTELAASGQGSGSGRIVVGNGANTDIVVASGKAYLYSLDLMQVGAKAYPQVAGV